MSSQSSYQKQPLQNDLIQKSEIVPGAMFLTNHSILMTRNHLLQFSHSNIREKTKQVVVIVKITEEDFSKDMKYVKITFLLEDGSQKTLTFLEYKTVTYFSSMTPITISWIEEFNRYCCRTDFDSNGSLLT